MFAGSVGSPYATPATIAMNLKQNGASYRQCYDWLGPNQPGVATPGPAGNCSPRQSSSSSGGGHGGWSSDRAAAALKSIAGLFDGAVELSALRG